MVAGGASRGSNSDSTCKTTTESVERLSADSTACYLTWLQVSQVEVPNQMLYLRSNLYTWFQIA